jgi:hypothetical protein
MPHVHATELKTDIEENQYIDLVISPYKKIHCAQIGRCRRIISNMADELRKLHLGCFDQVFAG